MNKVEYGLSKRVLQLATRSYRNGISLCEGLNPGLYEQIEFKYAYLYLFEARCIPNSLKEGKGFKL